MKKLKILIVDDSAENIEAAKIASKLFTQHEFVFMTSANEAFKQIGDFDAVITDLFFPEEPCEEMIESYQKIQSNYSLDNRIYKEIVGISYHLFPPERLQKNISIVKNGLNGEFPLGMLIMLRKKKCCLVSDIHCHGDADGQIILIPLVDEYILKIDHIRYDGEGSLRYIGSNRIYDIMNDSPEKKKKEKRNPLVWEKAIYCILAQ